MTDSICTRCVGTGVEPQADGIPCRDCKGTPSWARSSLSESSSSMAPVGDMAGAVADGVSDFFFWDAVGNVASSVVSGTGDAICAVGEGIGECAGAILGGIGEGLSGL